MLAVDPDAERTTAQIDLGNDAAAYVGAEALCLTAQVVHHLRAVDTLGITREVLDLGGRGKLSSRLDTLVEYGREICA